MPDHPVVSSDEWLRARKTLLTKEKEMSRRRDELTQLRRDLPWVKVDKSYVFDGPDGSQSLAELFGGCRQLIVYHFMFDPEWPEGCKICSMMADHYDPLIVHLRARDVNLVTISRADFATLDAYRQRMGWSFAWVSSINNDFNRDFHVSFRQEELDASQAYYNYQENVTFPMTEAPGISAFFRDADDSVYHTYSAYGRGLENFLGIYSFLDIVAKGRDEDDLPFSMAWVQHKDKY